MQRLSTFTSLAGFVAAACPRAHRTHPGSVRWVSRFPGLWQDSGRFAVAVLLREPERCQPVGPSHTGVGIGIEKPPDHLGVTALGRKHQGVLDWRSLAFGSAPRSRSTRTTSSRPALAAYMMAVYPSSSCACPRARRDTGCPQMTPGGSAQTPLAAILRCPLLQRKLRAMPRCSGGVCWPPPPGGIFRHQSHLLRRRCKGSSCHRQTTRWTRPHPGRNVNDYSGYRPCDGADIRGPERHVPEVFEGLVSVRHRSTVFPDTAPISWARTSPARARATQLGRRFGPYL